MLKYIPYVLMFAVATMINLRMGSLAHNAPETGSLQHALFKRNLQSQKSAQKK